MTGPDFFVDFEFRDPNTLHLDVVYDLKFSWVVNFVTETGTQK